MRMQFASKLPAVGTTIFSVMSELAVRHNAVNLGQGFPDFEPPLRLREALARAVADGRNQYPPGIGVAALREQIAAKTNALYGRATDPDTEVTVTSGATEAIFAAIAATVGAGDEVIVLDPAYDCYVPAIELQNARAIRVPLTRPDFAIDCVDHDATAVDDIDIRMLSKVLADTVECFRQQHVIRIEPGHDLAVGFFEAALNGSRLASIRSTGPVCELVIIFTYNINGMVGGSSVFDDVFQKRVILI